MKIKDKDIKLNYKNRAIYQWEIAMDKRFDLKTQYDEDVYLYCLVITNNEDVDLTFNEFSDWLEVNPSARKEFIDFLSRNDVKTEQFTVNDKTKGKAKKKSYQ